MVLIKVPYPDSVQFYEMYAWLEQNCKQDYYTGTNWSGDWLTGKLNRMVEFVSEEDAAFFALRWS